MSSRGEVACSCLVLQNCGWVRAAAEAGLGLHPCCVCRGPGEWRPPGAAHRWAPETPSRGTITAAGSGVGAGRPRCSRRSCLLCARGVGGRTQGSDFSRPAHVHPAAWASFLSVLRNLRDCRDTTDRELGLSRNQVISAHSHVLGDRSSPSAWKPTAEQASTHRAADAMVPRRSAHLGSRLSPAGSLLRHLRPCPLTNVPSCSPRALKHVRGYTSCRHNTRDVGRGAVCGVRVAPRPDGHFGEDPRARRTGACPARKARGAGSLTPAWSGCQGRVTQWRHCPRGG